MKKTMTLIVDYSSFDYLFESENKKSELENQGWEYIRTKQIGLDKFILYYEK